MRPARVARTEGIVERSRPNLGVVALLFLIGVSTLVRFSQNLFHLCQNVRLVDVVGVSGGSAACGAGIFALIFALASRTRP
jgi:hypothetical protein